MKVALVSPYDFAYPGGVTSHIASLARELRERGHSVAILSPCSQPPYSQRVEGLVPLGRPVPVPSGGSVARVSLSFWQAPRVKALLERERFEIVHVHEPLTPFLPLCVLHFSRAVNVGTFHAYHGRSRFYPWAKPVLLRWFRRLHGHIAVSPAAMRFVARYFPADYRVIPNGIEVDHFAQPTEPVPESGYIRPTLLFVGRLEKRKGLKYLLGAFARLKWEFPDLRLLVVGPGSPDKDSYRLLGERGLRDVVFVGPVAYGDLPRYYQAADVFCAPATGKESFGIVLLEAMAAGLPVVASHIDGYACVLQDGLQGFLVPPKDEEALASAIRRLLEDRSLREAMGRRGQERAREFDWERVAAQVEGYYEALLATRLVGTGRLHA